MDHPKKVVRNIPIFVESTNQTIINKDDETDGNFSQNFHPVQSENDNLKRVSSSSSSSTSANNCTQAKSYSNDDMTKQKVELQAENISEPENPSTNLQQQHPNSQEQKLESSIQKIQAIQNSVLDLMKKIEEYTGNKKEYVYLDEMLTQNLIKLDNIDINIEVEGKENVKNARREAIKCINSLISLLEEKNEELSRNSKDQTM